MYVSHLGVTMRCLNRSDLVSCHLPGLPNLSTRVLLSSVFFSQSKVLCKSMVNVFS